MSTPTPSDAAADTAAGTATGTAADAATDTATDTQAIVAAGADAADLFGTAPTLLLELTDALGRLAADAARLTDRGRRPFRADDAWARALGELGYRAYLLADQTGVGLDGAVRAVVAGITQTSQTAAAARRAADGDAWPLTE